MSQGKQPENEALSFFDRMEYNEGNIFSRSEKMFPLLRNERSESRRYHGTHEVRKCFLMKNGTFVDDARIYIGDGTMIAPNVSITAASHPISPKLRAEGYALKILCKQFPSFAK